MVSVLKQILIEGTFCSRCYKKVCVLAGVTPNKLVLKGIKKIDNKLSKESIPSLFNNVPTQSNRIMLLTFRGGYDCNPKAIANELLKRKLPISVVWVAKKEYLKEKDYFPKGLKVVRWGSYDFYHEAASSRVLVDNSVVCSSFNLHLKKDQYLIETWHGSLGLKRFDTNLDKKWIKKAKLAGKQTDYCISNSEFETKLYRDTFWNHNEILEFGHPRNDVLLQDSTRKKLKKKICSNYSIFSKTKILLYAPTFRDNLDLSVYNVDYSSILGALKRKFGGEWVIMTRLHLRVRDYLKRTKKDADIPDYVIDATNYPDIQELMAAADAGLSDYSSWVCDFVLTKRPIFLYTPDLDNYYAERGFYYPLTDTPFSISKTNEELIKNIESFDQVSYLGRCCDFLKDKGCIDDGLAAMRVVDHIVDLLHKQEVNNDKANLYLNKAEKYLIHDSEYGWNKGTDYLRKSIYYGSECARSRLIKVLSDSKNSRYAKEIMFHTIALYEKGLAGPEELYLMAEAHSNGKYVESNADKAWELYVQSAQFGYYPALSKISSILCDTKNFTAYSLLIDILKKSADAGILKANINLGRCYSKGLGVDIDYEESAKQYRVALNGGIAWACNELFDVLWKINTAESHKEMIHIVNEAVTQGNYKAMGRLARLYKKGIGLDKNLLLAVMWYCKSAEGEVNWAISEMNALINSEKFIKYLASNKYKSDVKKLTSAELKMVENVIKTHNGLIQ